VGWVASGQLSCGLGFENYTQRPCLVRRGDVATVVLKGFQPRVVVTVGGVGGVDVFSKCVKKT